MVLSKDERVDIIILCCNPNLSQRQILLNNAMLIMVPLLHRAQYRDYFLNLKKLDQFWTKRDLGIPQLMKTHKFQY